MECGDNMDQGWHVIEGGNYSETAPHILKGSAVCFCQATNSLCAHPFSQGDLLTIG